MSSEAIESQFLSGNRPIASKLPMTESTALADPPTAFSLPKPDFSEFGP